MSIADMTEMEDLLDNVADCFDDKMKQLFDELPEAGLDLGASGLTPKAAPKTPSTVRASPLQTWASTAKDLQEAQPVDEGVIHAQMRRSFDAGEAASKPEVEEAAPAWAPHPGPRQHLRPPSARVQRPARHQPPAILRERPARVFGN